MTELTRIRKSLESLLDMATDNKLSELGRIRILIEQLGITIGDGIKVADNGLTLDTGTVKLGGELVEATAIETDAFDLAVIKLGAQFIAGENIGGSSHSGIGRYFQDASMLTLDVLNDSGYLFKAAIDYATSTQSFFSIEADRFYASSCLDFLNPADANTIELNAQCFAVSSPTDDADKSIQEWSNLSGLVAILKRSGLFNLLQVPEYSSDALAGAGGLVAGDLYKTTSLGQATLKIKV